MRRHPRNRGNRMLVLHLIARPALAALIALTLAATGAAQAEPIPPSTVSSCAEIPESVVNDLRPSIAFPRSGAKMIRGREIKPRVRPLRIYADGSIEAIPIGTVTWLTKGRATVRRWIRGEGEPFRLAKAGRYRVTAAASWTIFSGGASFDCTATARRDLVVIRRLVAKRVLLRRIGNGLDALLRATKKPDYVRGADALGVLLDEVSGVRLRAARQTRALDRWIVASRRFETFLRTLGRRYPNLDQGDLGRAGRQGEAWFQATRRFTRALRS